VSDPVDLLPFGVGPIGQVLVPVSDVGRAAAFYRDILGIRYLFGFPGMAFLDAGGVRLYLASPEQEGFAGRSTLYFRVPDISAAVAELEARGVVFDGRPHMIFDDGSEQTWMCFTKDPDGNNVALMSEVASGG
jgi:catechol 2,3-dioxygenase-like lactoylglutathione lyase family enzyme